MGCTPTRCTAHRNRWEMKHPGPQRTDSLGSERPGRKAGARGLPWKLCSNFSRPGSASSERHPIPPETLSRGRKRATKGPWQDSWALPGLRPCPQQGQSRICRAGLEMGRAGGIVPPAGHYGKYIRDRREREGVLLQTSGAPALRALNWTPGFFFLAQEPPRSSSGDQGTGLQVGGYSGGSFPAKPQCMGSALGKEHLFQLNSARLC